jgi:cytoskeletal protein CcmA (bactofilin family)
MRALLAIVFSTFTMAALAGSSDEVTTRTLSNDRFIAGGNVTSTEPVAGDLIAAGGNVEISGPVTGDAIVTGGDVRLAGGIGSDLYAGAGELSVRSKVARNARLAGGKVELARDGKILGNASVAGGDVRLLGTIGGSLTGGAGKLLLDGRIAGDAEVGAGELRLGPSARIEGNLRYRSRKPLERDPAAQIVGSITRLEPTSGAGWPGAYARGAGRAAAWFWTVGLMALAAVLVALLPDATAAVTQRLRWHWPMSLLLGFVVLICVPFLLLLLLVTVIGIPLAILALLAYLTVMLIGYVVSGIALGEFARQRLQSAAPATTGARMLAAALAVLVLTIASRIPVLGSLIGFLALIGGIGAIMYQWRPSVRPAPGAP